MDTESESKRREEDDEMMAGMRMKDRRYEELQMMIRLKSLKGLPREKSAMVQPCDSTGRRDGNEAYFVDGDMREENK